MSMSAAIAVPLSSPGLTRGSSLSRHGYASLDCRVKPGNDKREMLCAAWEAK